MFQVGLPCYKGTELRPVSFNKRQQNEEAFFSRNIRGARMFLQCFPVSHAGNIFFSVIFLNTRAKRLRMRKVSIFKLAVANANFTTRMPVFELKSNLISIQNFKAGNLKPPGMQWSKDF